MSTENTPTPTVTAQDRELAVQIGDNCISAPFGGYMGVDREYAAQLIAAHRHAAVNDALASIMKYPNVVAYIEGLESDRAKVRQERDKLLAEWKGAEAIEAKANLLERELRYAQERDCRIQNVLDEAGVPTNGDEGHGKRQSLLLDQRVARLRADLRAANNLRELETSLVKELNKINFDLTERLRAYQTLVAKKDEALRWVAEYPYREGCGFPEYAITCTKRALNLTIDTIARAADAEGGVKP